MLLTYSTAVLCAVFIIAGAVSGGDEKKAVGETVSFSPDKLGSSVTSFTWKQIKGVMVVKAIEWDVDDGFNTPNTRFQGITNLDNKTGQITITKLKVEHSGVYTIDINSKEQEQRFTLEVMERVPKPEITIEKSSNPDVVYLRCNYSETIIWNNSTGNTLKGTKNHNPGEFIKVEKTNNPEYFYTCTFKNAVSEETSEPVSEGEIFGTGGGPWWIALIVIPIILAAAFILPYKLSVPFHDLVSSKCKDKPCIGAILYHLDGKKKDPPKSSSDAENGEKTEIDPLKSSSDAENGEVIRGNAETDHLTSPSDAEKGEGIRGNAETDPLTSSSDAEKGEGIHGNAETSPLTSPSDAEKGEGIHGKAETYHLTSPSDAEKGEGIHGNAETSPLTSSSDAEKGEGIHGNAETADGDKQEGSENSKEPPKADRDGGDIEVHL